MAVEPEPAPSSVAVPQHDDAATAVNLVWDAPPACADADTMQARLDEAMAVDVGGPPASRPRWVIARVRAEDDGRWTLRLWVAPEGSLSERTLHEESCAELERATLTIVAMLMPPVMAAAPPASPRAQSDEPTLDPDPMGEAELEALLGETPEAQPPPPDPGGPDMAPPPPSKVWGAIGFAGAVGRGSMPETGGGFAISSAVLIPGARFELVGTFLSTANIGISAAPGARSRYTLLTVAARGCAAPKVGRRAELLACGSFEAGSVLANVDGADLLHGPARPLVLTGIDTGVNIVLVPTVALRFTAHGWIALRQAQHQLLDGQLSQSGRFGYRLTGGVEFRFGGGRKARAFER